MRFLGSEEDRLPADPHRRGEAVAADRSRKGNPPMSLEWQKSATEDAAERALMHVVAEAMRRIEPELADREADKQKGADDEGTAV